MGTNQDLLSYNLFTYCSNNPINHSDPNGLFWGEIGNWFNSAVNAVVSTVKSVVSAVSSCVSSAWNTTSHWFSSTFGGNIASTVGNSVVSEAIARTEHQAKHLVGAAKHYAQPVVKNSGQVIRTIKSSAKSVSKICGALSSLTASSLVQDLIHYRGLDIGKAVVLDVGSSLASCCVGYLIGIAVGLATGGAALPIMLLGIAATGYLSYSISKQTDEWKEENCKYYN